MNAQRKKFSGIVLIALILSGGGSLLFVGSGYGYNWGMWDLGDALSVLLWGVGAAMAGSVISTVGAVATRYSGKRGYTASFIGLFLSLAVLIAFGYLYFSALHAPPLHDVSTDLEHPPMLVAHPGRLGASGPVAYPGGDAAKMQRQWYPDIKPLQVTTQPSAAYRKALETVKAMDGWTLQAADSSQNRIMVTSTVPWFGIPVETVVRITPTDQGSRIDLRSATLAGQTDMGLNAHRIRSFMDAYRSTD